jgi:transposase
MRAVAAEDLVFLDGTAVTVAMTRLWSRAPKGERAHGRAPKNWHKSVSAIGALGRAGLLAAMSIQGSVDGRVFEVYLREVLLPTLWRGAVVAMDNLSVHKPKWVGDLVESAGAKLVCLPSYSPDYNPIENCWSKLKEYLRSCGARTYERLDEALSRGVEMISNRDAEGWFEHRGYCITSK